MDSSSTQPDKPKSRWPSFLRIAFSTTCCLAALLLIVLWVQSYSTGALLYIPLKNDATWVRTFNGQVMYQRMNVRHSQLYKSRWNVSLNSRDRYMQMQLQKRRWAWDTDQAGHYTFATIPCFAAVAAMTAAAIAPWIRWRFSLRTLLIATTLIALALGLLIATTR